MIFILVPVFCFAADTRSVAVKKFSNKSEYKGEWDIGGGISRLLSENLPSRLYTVTDAGAEYTLNGIVEEFTLASKGLAAYSVGGYQDYSAKVTLDLTLKTQEKRTAASFKVTGRRMQQSLGLTLLGGPVGDDRYLAELNRLWKLKFDSPEFKATVLGQAVNDAVYQALPKISLAVYGVPYGLRGDIVKARGRQLFLDIGAENGVKAGQVFTAYSTPAKVLHPRTGENIGNIPSAKIGMIEITEVIGPKLSKAQLKEASGGENAMPDINNEGPVKEGDYAVFE